MGNLVSRGRSVDLILNGKHYELKTGAGGELGNADKKALHGSSMVIYCPVYDETVSVEEQEAFVIEKNAFLQVIKDAGLYRETKTTRQISIKFTLYKLFGIEAKKRHIPKKPITGC